MRLFKRAKQTRATLSVILASDHVGLFIALAGESREPRIVFEISKPIQQSASNKPLLSRLSSALTALAEETLEEGLPHIISKKIAKGHFDAIRVFYGAPWYVSRGREISVLRAGEKTPLTENSLQELILENTKGLLPADMKDAVILEKHARGFTVNGYPIEDPIGMEGKEIGMRLFVSAIDSGTKETVETILHRSFHSHILTHHSTLLHLAESLQSSSALTGEYLLIDVSGRMTEVSRVDRGMILDTVSFPEGFDTLAHKAAETLKRPKEEMRTMEKNPNDFGLTEEFKIATDSARSSWSTAYAEAFETLQGAGMPIDTAVLIADTPLQDAFKRDIERISNIVVRPLSPKSYHSLYDASARPNAQTISALLALWESL